MDHKELIVFVGPIDVVFFLADHSRPKVGIASQGSVLERLEEGVGELGEYILEHELLREGEGLDILYGQEAELSLGIEEDIVVSEEIFGEQVLR